MPATVSLRDVGVRTPALRLVADEPDTVSFEVIVEEGQLAERQGRRDDARRHYERALTVLAEAESGREAGALLRWIARTHQVDGSAELALDCLQGAIAVAEAYDDGAALGHATNLEAIVHWQQGDLECAEKLFLSARALAIGAGEAKLAAMTAQNLGVIANIRGDLATALRHYEAALIDYRALGLASDVCVALNNLGMLHTDRHQWDDAARAYEEALHIAEVLGDLSTRIMIEVNVAECWVAQADFDRARAVCDRAMELSRHADDTRAHGELFKLYGIIAREAGDMALAEQCLMRAHEIADRRNDLLLLAECARETAELRRRQNRNRDTLQSLNRAHRLFTQLHARRDLADVDRRMGQLESDFLEVVRRWGESIESKDRYTQGHCERVADLACALAAKAGMDAQSLFWFRIGAMLHDVGKLVIPSEVLNKPGQLTQGEWALVQQHPTAGVEMLADIDFPWDVRPVVESHHERWDGKGYPHRLRGEQIPRTARILCIADVYDALTSERSYKRPLSHAEAMDVMRLDVGTQFDPTLFACFEEVVTERATRPPVRKREQFHDGPAARARRPCTHGDSSMTRRPGFLALLIASLAGLAGCGADATVAPTLFRSEKAGAPTAPPTPGVLNPIPAAEFIATDTVWVLKRTASLPNDISVSATIGPEGGEIKIDEAGAKIEFPVGALQKPTLITMTAKAGWNVAYEFAPHGLKFDADVKIQQDLRVTKAYHNPSVTAKLKGAYYKNLEASFIDPWNLLAEVREVCPVEIDKVNSRLAKFYIRHFSGYLMSSGVLDWTGGFGGDGW